MKVSLLFFVIQEISAGYYQQHRHLSAIEKNARQTECLTKAEETKAQFSIENGSWNCPDEGKIVSRLKCVPICDSGMKPDWKSKPRKLAPRFLIRCGAPPTVVKK